MLITITKRRRISKGLPMFLLLTILNQLFSPAVAYALTAGPTAPEATNFEPVDTTDMVNPLTGGLTYNMPLLEVPGPEGSYPLSLAYHAGVQPNEEASWVGLGWSLNPGAIARSVNGYADDWNGVPGEERDYWSGGTTKTFGVDFGILGMASSVNVGLSFSSDTYRGFGVGSDVGFGIKALGLGATIGVSPYGQAYAGVYEQGQLPSEAQGYGISGKLGLSTNFNTVEGMASAGVSYRGSNLLGATIRTSNTTPSWSVGNGEISAVNNANAGKISTSSFGFTIPIPIGAYEINLSYSYQRYWSDETTNFTANGVLFGRAGITGLTDLDASGDDNYQLLDPINGNIADNSDPLKVLGGTFPNFDNYTVTAQGLGGNIRPYIFSTVLYNQNRTNNNDHTNDVKGQAIPTSGQVNSKWQFRFINDQSNSYRQTYTSTTPGATYNFDSNPVYGNNDGNAGYDATANRLEGSKHIEYFTNLQISDGDAAKRGFIDCDAAGFVRKNDAKGQSQIGGFMITNASGVTYHYALPAYSQNETVFTELVNKANGQNNSTLHKNDPYAYTWYLTAITGPDYVYRVAQGKIDKSDWGYWVKFDYGKWAGSYNWRNPSEGSNRDIDNNFQNYSSGSKELYYLDAIETRSHTALFVKDVRNDGKGMGANSGFDNTSVSSLNLSYILLLQADQMTSSLSTIRNAGALSSAGGTSANVIDVNDITQLSEPLVSKCLRKVQLNYDYSLCPGVSNSFLSSDPNTKFGKLSLLSLEMKGKGGTAILPPTSFQYDIDQYDPANQDNISIITPGAANAQGTNQSGQIQVQTQYKFKVGDVLAYKYNAQIYYCTLTATADGLNFNVVFIKNSPLGNSYNLPATRTKNPPYSKDGYDNWGSFKSDFLPSPTGNENLSRFTTPVSTKSVDAWSLRKVVSSIGSEININYEGNTYNKSVLNKNRSLSMSALTRSGTQQYTFTVNSEGVDLSTIYRQGDKVSFIAEKLIYSTDPSSLIRVYNPFFAVNSNSYTTPATLQSISGNTLTVTVDQQMDSYMSSAAGCQYLNVTTGDSGTTGSIGFKAIMIGGNLIANGASFFYGGGTRVRDIMVDNLNGQQKKTSYNYGVLGSTSGQRSSSGVTSYEPLVLDVSFPANPAFATNQITNPSYLPLTVFKRELYKDASNLVAISREVPGPGVMYETVGVADSVIASNGKMIPLDGTTVLQYNVFKPEMVGIQENNYLKPVAVNSNKTEGLSSVLIANQSRRDVSIKDYTSRLGTLRRVITYDNLGNKLTEKINHYLWDDLQNTSFNKQVSSYEPRLGTFTNASGFVVNYNYQGVIKERYGNARLSYSTSSSWDDLVVMSNKETFPAFQTGTTQIDYKNGTKTEQQNLAYDFYSGNVTKTMMADSYGNRFINQITPAYQVYPSMGLKTHDDPSTQVYHAQMLGQQASNYTFSIDASNNPVGVVTATVQTWGNDIPVLDHNGAATTGGQSNIWRMKANYTWMPSGSSTSNVALYSSFVDYFGPNGNTNASWKQVSNVTQYNVYSAALEATDIDLRASATRMGYNNTKVLVSAANAKYSEVAFTGAEDPLLTGGNFSSNISPGSGTVIADTLNVHTGTSSLLVGAGQKGFNYTVPVSSLTTGRDYTVAVWVKPTAANVAQASLYYQVNGGTVVVPTQAFAKTAAGWYLMEMTVPGTALTAGNLVVGCQNGSASALYFDDFRFQPVTASATAYVYDKLTGELSYILNNKDIYTRYQYDAIGRLLRVYKEVVGKPSAPVVKAVAYNYAKKTFYNHIATGTFFSQICTSGEPINYVVPKGRYSAGTAQDANNLAQVDITANGQAYANASNCNIPVTLANSTNVWGFVAKYTNNTTGAVVNYTFNPTGSLTVYMAPGTYTVNVLPPNTNFTHIFTMGGRPTQNAQGAYFTSVNVNPGSTDLHLSIQ
jgi:hypothetical protein